MERDGVHFLTGKTAPFSGQIEFTHEEEITLEHLQDPRVMLVNFRMEFLHGKLNGTTIETLEDGTTSRRYTHKNGVREGPSHYPVDFTTVNFLIFFKNKCCIINTLININHSKWI